MMIHGLYAITPDELDTALLLERVNNALIGGANIVQYRNKLASEALKVQQATQLRHLCKAHLVPFIINDSIALCLAVDADGVHLGADDGHLSEARTTLGESKILGASCYNRFDLALHAQNAGANYVAFGACFASSTKPNAPVAALDLFTRAKKELNIPTVAIGGITLENAALVINAGANSIAVIHALFNVNNVTLAARSFDKLFN
jgi:thiamine-phosphate pyrophosphorylase